MNRNAPHAKPGGHRDGTRRLLVTVLALLIATPATVSGRAPKTVQRLANGGFERGLHGWKATGNFTLIEDPAMSHGGIRCLRGEVKRPDSGAVLKRTLKLHAGRLYRLVIWARSERRNRMTVYLRAGERKTVVGNWNRVPRTWRRYRANFTVPEDGPVTLGVVAPSSHRGNRGRMWIDDLSIREERLWPRLELSEGEGFDDYPVMEAASDGAAWAAWLSYRDGRDTLRLARLRPAGASVHVEQTWALPASPGARVLHPALATGADGGAFLLYAAEQAGNWDVFAVPIGAAGPGEAMRITTDTGSDVHPTGAVLDDTLWIAWESNRDEGEHQIYLTALRAGHVGTPRRLTPSGCNNYAPAAVASGRRLWVVWHSFRENNFDLYARPVTAGAVDPEVRLTHAPGIDREARLAARDDQVWLAWEHASYTGYQLGRATTKRVLLARLRDGRLRAPAGLKKTQLWKNAQSPALAIDRRGRLWVAARVPRDRNSGWDTVLWRCARRQWSRPWLLSWRKGRSRPPAVVVFGRRAAVCYQGDDLPDRWSSVEKSKQGTSRIYLATVTPPGPSPVGPPALVLLDEPRDRFEAGRIRLRRGEDRRGWSLEQGGRNLRLFFGDLHEHTDISVCDRARDETPEQSFQMMRDITRCDFAALTDHGKSINDYFWNHAGKITRANNDPGRFMTLRAQEWTSSFERSTPTHPHGYYGHRNLILANPFFPRWFNAAEDCTPTQLWQTLRGMEADFVVIPHQLADRGNVPVDFGHHDETAQPVAEIFQGRGSYECRGCLRQAAKSIPGYFLHDAWARGLVVGVIASPDHYGGLGKAAVYAPELTPAALLEALRARRCYGTTGAKIFVDFRVDDHFMGEVGPAPGDLPVRIAVRVDAPAPLRAVEILRNEQTIFRAEPRGTRCTFSYTDGAPGGPVRYYLRVIQRDGEMAWTSPVWLGRPAGEVGR